MPPPFFTIGIPVYNAEKYLNLCLDSILSQSFEDYELVLVNDGSTDNSLEICKSYQAKDSRIVIIDQENGGVSAASNHIIDVAKGTYVYLMDNDDEMHEGILQTAHNYLEKNPIDILHGSYYVKSPNQDKKLRIFKNPFIINGFENHIQFLEYEKNIGYSTSMWTKFIRNRFWQESEVKFQTKYNGVQDLDVSRRLMCKAKTVHYIDDVILTWYHPREGSISTEWSFSMMRNYWRLTSDIICEAVETFEDNSKDKDAYIEKFIKNSGGQLWRLNSYKNEQLKELEIIINPIRKYFKPEYVADKRTKIMFFLVKYFGAVRAASMIKIIRKTKHKLLGR